MQLTAEQFKRIAPYLPVQRGNVRLDNLQLLNAILYIAANGCKWRALPAHFGNWHTIYMRIKRWNESGVLARVFEQLQRQRLLNVRIESVCLDSSSVKVHPDSTGASPKTGRKPLGAAGENGIPKLIWLPQMSTTSSPGA
jgi:transposase